MSAEATITAGAPAAAQADRAVNKAVNSFSYDGDLVQDVENETVKIEDVKEDQLPAELKKISPAERKRKSKNASRTKTDSRGNFDALETAR
jgi:hypothetical protein